MRARVVAFAAFIAVLILTAWLVSTRSSGEVAQAPTTPPAATPSTPVPSPTPAPTVATSEPEPAEPLAEQAAAAAAVEFISAWLDQSREHWWQHLAPLMSEPAAQIYSSVDPTTIPPGHTVLPGTGEIVGDASQISCRVLVETTEGDYLVYLLRDRADGPWLVDRIDQPGAT